jgi:DnaJ-class molecular chaperone
MNRKRALEILGMSEENCDNDDGQSVKNAYRERILQYHPDKNR